MKENENESKSIAVEEKKIGKSKLQGFKNMFGVVDKHLKEKVKKSEDFLNKLYKDVKAKYKQLQPSEIYYDDECGKKLKEALEKLKDLCDTAEGEGNINGKGREFGKYMFSDYGKLDKIGRDWDNFLEGTALLLTLYAKCGRTSAVPYSSLGDAANICEKYYVYVASYCAMLQKLKDNQINSTNDIKLNTEEKDKDVIYVDKRVNKEMKEITKAKIQKNEDWAETKKEILEKAKKIGGTIFKVFTSPFWGTACGVKYLAKKLGLGKKEKDLQEDLF